MVEHQPEALRSTESQRQIEAERDRTRTDRPQLWSATAAVPIAGNPSALHPGGVQKAPCSIAPLRGASSLTPSAIHRVDRNGQARRDESQTSERGDPPAHG